MKFLKNKALETTEIFQNDTTRVGNFAMELRKADLNKNVEDID